MMKWRHAGVVALAAGWAAVATASLAPGAGAATCSTSEAIYPRITAPSYYATPAFTFASSDDCFRFGFDLAAGTLAVKHCGGLGRTSVTGRDLFDVAGVPAGTVVIAVAELWADGEIISYGCGGSGCYGSLRIWVTSGGVTNEQLLSRQMYTAGTEPVHGVTGLPITFTAGQPVQIEYGLAGFRSPGGNHGALGSAQLRFTGLPQGATAVSCQGYSQLPVPALRSSWGRLKTLYR